jgi:hypothetical protein
MCACVVLSTGTAEAFTLKELLDDRLDTAPDYRTIVTGHFWVHFPEELEPLGADIAAAAEEIYGPVTEKLGDRPGGRTHVVVVTKSDRPNTFTFNHPARQIFSMPRFLRFPWA